MDRDRPEKSPEAPEPIDAHLVWSETVREEVVCRRLGINRDILEVCLRWEIIGPPELDAEGVPVFRSEALERVRKSIRLHYDLGINWAGITVILDLLDRLEALEWEHRQEWGGF